MLMHLDSQKPAKDMEIARNSWKTVHLNGRRMEDEKLKGGMGRKGERKETLSFKVLE